MNAFATSLFVLCKLFVLFSYANAWGRGDLEKYGPVNLALNSKLIKCDRNRSLDLDVSSIQIHFYDFSRNVIKDFAIKEAARAILSLEKLDKNRKFIIYVGGYKSQINKHAQERIRDTFRKQSNVYLIIPDHFSYTNDKNGFKYSYERSVTHVYYIGKALGHMLSDLKQGGISPKNLHCIGFSLGGQILGTTGEVFAEITGEKVWRITALDPAGPCFSKSLSHEQVRSGIAEYVEVYHCNAGTLGTSSVLGDIDFFVNKKGESQPNCGTPYIPGIFDSMKAAQCSHRTCIQIYMATVNHPGWFPAWRCDSYKKFKKADCPNDGKTTAGYWNPGTATGVYYFSTEGYVLD